MNIRVWDKIYREFWDDSSIKENYEWLMCCKNDTSGNHKDVIVEKITDYKDISGKSIFEGDKIRCIGYGTFVVRWNKNENNWSFVTIEKRKKNWKWHNPLDMLNYDWEVVGHIHENQRYVNMDWTVYDYIKSTPKDNAETNLDKLLSKQFGHGSITVPVKFLKKLKTKLSRQNKKLQLLKKVSKK